MVGTDVASAEMCTLSRLVGGPGTKQGRATFPLRVSVRRCTGIGPGGEQPRSVVKYYVGAHSGILSGSAYLSRVADTLSWIVLMYCYDNEL